MRILTAELSNFALDYMVAICVGKSPIKCNAQGVWVRALAGPTNLTSWAPSTDFSQGGEISSNAGLSCEYFPAGAFELEAFWQAKSKETTGGMPCQTTYGETELVAKMRCLVATRFGDYVEVPAAYCLPMKSGDAAILPGAPLLEKAGTIWSETNALAFGFMHPPKKRVEQAAHIR